MPTLRLFGGRLMPFSESNTTTSSMMIRPELGSSRPARQRMVLVLPQPDWPRRTRASPSPMSRLRFSMATKSPYLSCKFWMLIFMTRPCEC